MTYLKYYTRYDQGPGIHGKAKESVTSSQPSLADWMPESMGRWSILSVTQASSDYVARCHSGPVYKVSVSAATLDWCTALSCYID